jgi:alpha-1,6-mannosyltransferase
MLRAIFRDSRFFYTAAFTTAVVLCGVFAYGGIASFFQIITGEEASFNDASFNGFSGVRFLATVTYIGLCAFYLIWLLRKKPPLNDLKFSQILKPALPFLLLALMAYPLSNDIYLYLQYGLMGLRGVNPYIVSASKVSTVLDPLLYWLQTSTYGPVSELFFMGSALFIRISPVVGVYVFKVFCLLAYIVNAYLIWCLLKNSPNRSKLTMAYVFNPFLLIAHIADAHVDVFLCTSIIILIGCLYNRFYVGAVLAVVSGFLTKTLPIIWLPLVLSFLVWRRRWRALGVAIVLSAAIVVVLSQTVFPTIVAWKSLLNPGVSGLTARSIHHLINLILAFSTGSDLWEQQSIIQQLSRVTFLGFAIFYAWKLLRPYLKRTYSEVKLVTDLGWVTLVLLLGATPWMMPWYPSVLLPFAVLSRNAPLFLLTSFVFCLTTGAVIGTGSGDTPLSFAGTVITLAPAMAVILWRQQAVQTLHKLLKSQDTLSVLPSSSENAQPSTPLR